jgi:hypothetical protein
MPLCMDELQRETRGPYIVSNGNIANIIIVHCAKRSMHSKEGRVSGFIFLYFINHSVCAPCFLQDLPSEWS